MASTALHGEETKEFFDPPEELAKKLDTLAEWIRASKHFVAFTGAGISTSAGIPDFRSGMDTKLPIGAGVWTLKAHKTGRTKNQSARTRSTFNAIPTETHMLLVELAERGLLKHLTSQNTDGLHMRSGFDPERLAELHGNSCLEICSGKGGCGKRFLRDYHTRRSSNSVHDHVTDRHCTCGKPLYDSIINFGESLPESDLDAAFRNHRKADLCLSMGSSLRVTPAADCPAECAERGGKLVVVNLQSTPLDKAAAMVIHALCDDVSRGLAERLKLAIPPFKLRRWIRFSPSSTAKEGDAVTVRGVGRDGTPYDILRGVRCTATSASSARVPVTVDNDLPKTAASGEARTRLPSKWILRLPAGVLASATGSVDVRCSFLGNYGEPDATFSLALPLTEVKTVQIAYRPGEASWESDDAVLSAASSSSSATSATSGAGASSASEPAPVAVAKPVAAKVPAKPVVADPVVARPRAANPVLAKPFAARGVPQQAAAPTRLTAKEMERAAKNVASVADEMKSLE